VISRANQAVAYLLVGSVRPDRSRARLQTKRGSRVLQVGGLGSGIRLTSRFGEKHAR